MCLDVCMAYLRLPNRTFFPHPDLDNLVAARGEQASGGGLVVHVNNAVLAVMEGCSGRTAGTHKGSTGYAPVRRHVA